MSSPVQILSLSKQKVTFNLDPFYLLLKKVGDRPFVVYSINGNSRKGKSLMCNFFLQFLNNQSNPEWFEPSQLQNQFFWKGGINRVTEGIFVWPEPFLVTNEQNGSETCVILMDTQGAFDDRTSTHENAIIFAFSLLLSSVLIWNQPKDITDDVLQFFEMFLGFAKLAGDDNGDSATQQNTSESLNTPEFQKLIFLIRDFAYDYTLGYFDDDTSQDNNFMIDRLSPLEKRAPELNFRRNQILSSFESTGVFTLPHPGKGLTQSHDLNGLDSDFEELTREFVTFLFSGDILRHAKKVRGIPVTGNNFGTFVQHWARYFTSPDTPRMQDIMNTTSEIQIKIGLQSAADYFLPSMEEYFSAHPNGVEISELEDQVNQSKSVSLKIFLSFCKSTSKNPLTQAKHESRFHEEIQLSVDHYMSLNLIRRRYKHSQELLQQEQANLKETIQKSEQQLRQIKEKSARDQAEFEVNFARIKAEGEAELLRLKKQEQERLQRLKEQMEAEAIRVAQQLEEQRRREAEILQQAETLRIQRQQHIDQLNANLQNRRRRSGGIFGGCTVM